MAGDDALSFPHDWRAEVLARPPLIAPARQFTYPQQVAGEEDALARGALLVLVHPAGAGKTGGDFLATCALGFTDPAMPTGIFACPNPRELCAVAGGYAYVLDTAVARALHPHPAQAGRRSPRPRRARPARLRRLPRDRRVGQGRSRLADRAPQLGRNPRHRLRADANGTAALHGFGWNLTTDKEVEFSVDLRTGAHTGGGF